MSAATPTGRSDVDPADLKPFEPLMDAVLEPYGEQILDDREYDDLSLGEKADYMVGLVQGEHEVRDDVTYGVDRRGRDAKTEFSVSGLYRWLRDVTGAPRDGSEPFQEMRDVPEEHRTGNEDRLVENLNREPQYGMSWDGTVDPDVTWPDPAVGTRSGTTLDFEPW